TTVEVGAIAASLIHEVNHPPLDAAASKGIYNELIRSHQKIEEIINNYDQNYDQPGFIIQQWEEEMSKSREVKEQLAEGEKQFKELLNEYEAISSLFNMKEEYEVAVAEYKEVEKKYNFNIKVNSEIHDFEQVSKSDQKTGRKRALSSLTMLNGLLQKLEGS